MRTDFVVYFRKRNWKGHILMAEQERRLVPHLSPAGAWAMALGTSIGWGSLVLTGRSWLAKAGPLGSTLGMAAGALIMLLICRNYACMAKAFPGAGGAYTWVKEVFGWDRAFLVSWFLSLTYLAMLWANATALPLFARSFFGNIFEFGKLYSLFGYDVYLGEAVLTMAAILLVAALCAHSRRLTAGLMLGMVACFTLGITVCFLASAFSRGLDYAPAFVPDTKAVSQVLQIAVISPWAFIGFENISHATEELSFQRTRFHRVLVVSVITATLLYVFVTLLSAAAYPPRYASWLDYIRDLGNLEGIETLPAFYAARHFLGSAGVVILMVSLLCLVLTSLIGNTLALSRLFYALGKDKVLPPKFGELSKRGIPSRAVALVAAVSLLVPFVGRTAIGWIVDVTTLGATLVYGFVSACALKLSRQHGDRRGMWAGILGLFFMVCIGLYLVLPDLFASEPVGGESYFLFALWAVLGILYFRTVLKRDGKARFGRSLVVWVAMLSLILFVSLVWMSHSVTGAAVNGVRAVEEYYLQEGIQARSSVSEEQIGIIRNANVWSLSVVVGLFALALGVVLNNYSVMRKQAHENETLLGKIRDMANTDPLTGVKSKHAWAEREKELDEAIRSGAAPDFAVAVCDVNGLKFINDTLGHKAGDEHIRAACKIICWIFEHSPVYRTGGDEFVVLLTGSDYDHRTELMDMLHSRSVEHIESGDPVVSGGLSDYVRGQDENLHPVFERADALMYQEKQLLKSMGAATR